MLKNRWISKKFELKWKNKTFTRCKQQANLRKLFRLPPPLFHVFGTKIFLIRYTEIYRNIQKFAFKVLHECSFWVSKNCAVKMFFLAPNRNMFAEIFVVKSERFLAVLRDHIIFNFKWVEIRKISDVFWAKLYCKISVLYW